MHDHELIETEWHTMPHIKPTEKLVITSEVVNIGNRYGHKLTGISMVSKHVRIHDSTFNFTVNAISDPRTAIMGELRMVMLAKGFTPTDNSHLRLRIVNEGFNVDDIDQKSELSKSIWEMHKPRGVSSGPVLGSNPAKIHREWKKNMDDSWKKRSEEIESFNSSFNTWFRVFGITLIISIILFWVFVALLVDKYLL